MEIDNLRLITCLSERYTDELCKAKGDSVFNRGSIVAAYLVGATETLHRVMNVIRESVQPRGITDIQARRLIEVITIIENSEPQRLTT